MSDSSIDNTPSDNEKGSHRAAEKPQADGLKRQLKNRHVAMISIGGVIGTGLFLGTATSLRNGGPISLLLGFIILGSICYSVMITLGEIVTYLPIAGGPITLAERFVNRSLSFTLGWNYWYNWVVLLPAELSASAVIVSFWSRTINPGVWIAIFFVIISVINFLGAGAYGECEFVFASIKVLTIVGLLILGIVLDLGGGPNHDRLGFRYWKHPGPFVQFHDIPGPTGRFLGWWAVMSQAAFSFLGAEVVAIAAGEAKNPRRNIPKAIKRVYIRILLFYIGGTLLIGLTVPSNDPGLNLSATTAAASPFVIAIKNAGIKGLPHLINACLLSSAWSAASSDLYTSSRALYGLALSGNAPRFFAKTTKHGLPMRAVIVSCLLACLSFMATTSAGKVFQWFVNMASIAGMMTWFGICVTYLRFYAGLKAQGIDRKTLPYSTRLQPYAAWYCLIGSLCICIFSGFEVFLKDSWATDTFVTNYLPLALFPILYFGSRYLVYKQPMVDPKDMDFYSGLEEIENATFDEPPPRNMWEHFWQWVA